MIRLKKNKFMKTVCFSADCFYFWRKVFLLLNKSMEVMI